MVIFISAIEVSSNQTMNESLDAALIDVIVERTWNETQEGLEPIELRGDNHPI